MTEDAMAMMVGGLAAAWAWDGWSRVSDLATVVTAIATGSIALWLYLERWAQVRRIEAYLKRVGRNRGPDDQGLRSAENISRKLDIPVDDVKRLAHASHKIVSRIRTHGPEQDHTLLWGHRRYVRGKK